MELTDLQQYSWINQRCNHSLSYFCWKVSSYSSHPPSIQRVSKAHCFQNEGHLNTKNNGRFQITVSKCIICKHLAILEFGGGLSKASSRKAQEFCLCPRRGEEEGLRGKGVSCVNTECGGQVRWCCDRTAPSRGRCWSVWSLLGTPSTPAPASFDHCGFVFLPLLFLALVTITLGKPWDLRFGQWFKVYWEIPYSLSQEGKSSLSLTPKAWGQWLELKLTRKRSRQTAPSLLADTASSSLWTLGFEIKPIFCRLERNVGAGKPCLSMACLGEVCFQD